MRIDGQTDGQGEVLKLIVFFRNCTSAPKNVNEEYYVWHVTSCSLTDGTDVSEEHVTAFFGVEK
jgi:hypothetical protein